MDVFTPTPRNWRELERPVDVFSPALENRDAGSLVDCISPASRNKKKQEHPGDVFSPY